MAHQHQGRGLALGKPLQRRSALPHLADRSRSTGEIGIVQSLNAVNDCHSRPQRLQFFKNELQIGFSQQLQIGGPRSRKPLPAELYLLG